MLRSIAGTRHHSPSIALGIALPHARQASLEEFILGLSGRKLYPADLCFGGVTR